MDFGAANVCGPMFSLETMSGGSGSNPNRIIGVDITFTCPGTETIRRSFLRSEWHAVHLGREPADISGVANAFQRTDVVPPVMSRKHAEIMFNSETPQVMDIGSYHGTYFRASGQRLIVNKPYLLADGLVLEFGKSVTKDDKAHEPLLATIRFIHESDRDRARFLVTGREQVSSLLSAPSPPRRYSVPSDSEDEDEDESDEDDETSSHSDVFEYTPQPTHIDLTTMSDDGKSSVGDDGDGIECVGFGFSRSGYEEESVSSSDMSESEYEEDVGKVVTPPGGAAAGPSSTHGLITPPVELVAPAPISLPRLPRIEAALSGLQEYHEIGFYPLGLPDFASRAMEDNSRASGSGLEWYIPSGEQVHQGPSQVQHGPSHEPSQVRREQVDQMEAPQHEATQAPVMSEEVRSLKADLEVAQNEITELKRSLAEKEKRDQDGDVTIVEAPVAEEATETPAADDLPTLITNIENMMGQLSTVGDDELRDHRRVVLQLLARLTTERETLWHRVGSPTISRAIANKRKREEDEEAEPRRAQSPLPATTPAPEPVSVPTPTPAPGPSPAKRLRVNPVVSALASGVVVWGALASGYL